MKVVLCLMLIAPFLLWVVIRTTKSANFKIACEGHLKRASDATTVPLAVQELEIALKYLKDNELTNGYTSITFEDPSEDIQFWYTNILAAKEELKKMPKDANMLTKSSVLLKLRGSIMYSKGEKSVLVPEGISVYPFNALFAIFGWGTLVMLFCGAIGIIIICNE